MTITCPETWWAFQQWGRQLIRAPHQNGQTPRRMGTLKVGKGVTDHPYGLIRGNSRAVERHKDRVRRWFVALGVLGADRTGDPALPT